MKRLIASVFLPVLLLGCAEKPQPEPASPPTRTVQTESKSSVPVGWEGIRPSGVHPQMVYSNGIFVVLEPTRPCQDCGRPLPVDFTNRCPWCSTPQRSQERIPLDLTKLRQRTDIHPQYFQPRGSISVTDPPVVVGPRRY